MTLDDLNIIQSLDTQDQLGSIKLLGKQFQHGWENVHALTIPDTYKDISKIVFSGMGGSALGAYVTRYLYGLDLPVPYEIINDYHLPSYVDNTTLVITQSYSGSTEETLSSYNEAHSKGAHIFSISAGGTLQQRAQENNTLHCTIVPTYNPCNQPRMAIGYSVVAQLALLHRLQLIHISDEELADCQRITEENTQKYSEHVLTDQNNAKQTALSLFDKVPLYCAGEFLQGAIHAMRNQINENAKTYAGEHPVPEMNHHLLEALQFPVGFKNHATYIFVNSDLYSPRIQKRMNLCQTIIEEAGHKVITIQAEGSYKISQILSTIQYGAYVGLYLAVLENIDPSPIPHVEKLKKLLAK